MTTFKDQICDATDRLTAAKADYYQGRGSYDAAKAAAIEVLTIRQSIEQAKMGKVKTKITPVTIASLIR